MLYSLMPFLAEIPLELNPDQLALMPNAWIVGVVYFFLLMASASIATQR